MTQATLHPLIDQRFFCDNGQRRLVQVVRCTCPECSGKLTVPAANGKRKSASVVFNIARRRGWIVQPKKGVAKCPSH